ncbi:MAG: DUF4157 domain-containing protein [Lachnospiraceae bacterium]|nr:DUF4157 domain-containing protein [Acetatifactor muris]MCM1223727.1 DUF4157 domain-containing protein [Lachnospiraceae bacterium]MCM1560006.1 DUF4157 domain-containing protein [Butyrivibrio sp.]
MGFTNASMERGWKRAKAASGSTGIPGAMQAKFEAASGLSFEDVRVHYNSSRPAQLGAYAYTQGSQVYIGPGQERHLEHELGHVIQQKQGIVKADGYVNGVPVNRDRRLEQAADLGAVQPVQGLWRNPGGVAQMAPPEEEEEETEQEEPVEVVPAPGTLSNVEAREWYLEQERRIPDRIDRSRPLEEQARQAFELRNQYRTRARELMADRELADRLNATEPNLTWEQLVQKQRDKGLEGDAIYEAIIASAQRSRVSVNQALGIQ